MIGQEEGPGRAGAHGKGHTRDGVVLLYGLRDAIRLHLVRPAGKVIGRQGACPLGVDLFDLASPLAKNARGAKTATVAVVDETPHLERQVML